MKVLTAPIDRASIDDLLRRGATQIDKHGSEVPIHPAYDRCWM
jgi:hypothetical protein